MSWRRASMPGFQQMIVARACFSRRAANPSRKPARAASLRLEALFSSAADLKASMSASFPHADLRKFRLAIMCFPAARSPPWRYATPASAFCQASPVTRIHAPRRALRRGFSSTRTILARVNGKDARSPISCSLAIMQKSNLGAWQRHKKLPASEGRICLNGDEKVYAAAPLARVGTRKAGGRCKSYSARFAVMPTAAGRVLLGLALWRSKAVQVSQAYSGLLRRQALRYDEAICRVGGYQ